MKIISLFVLGLLCSLSAHAYDNSDLIGDNKAVLGQDADEVLKVLFPTQWKYYDKIGDSAENADNSALQPYEDFFNKQRDQLINTGKVWEAHGTKTVGEAMAPEVLAGIHRVSVSKQMAALNKLKAEQADLQNGASWKKYKKLKTPSSGETNYGSETAY